MIHRKRAKPGTKYPVINNVKIYPDGRERCLDTPLGRIVYCGRLRSMCDLQKELCAICGEFMGFPTFDHQDGRGSGGSRRDDRTEIYGKRYNAALCAECNTRKGSQRYHWQDGKYVPVDAA
jgi:hypothetical protein